MRESILWVRKNFHPVGLWSKTKPHLQIWRHFILIERKSPSLSSANTDSVMMKNPIPAEKTAPTARQWVSTGFKRVSIADGQENVCPEKKNGKPPLGVSPAFPTPGGRCSFPTAPIYWGKKTDTFFLRRWALFNLAPVPAA